MTRWTSYKERFKGRADERGLRRHVTQAAAVFERLEPELAATLFDEPFLTRFHPHELLRMEPRDLALEWSRQFNYADQRRRDRDVARVTEAADAYLALLWRVVTGEDPAAATKPSRRLPWSRRRSGSRRRGATLAP